MGKVKDGLNAAESGWGGSPTFICSKQGEACEVETTDVQKLVYANLMSEYKKKITSSLNKGTGREV